MRFKKAFRSFLRSVRRIAIALAVVLLPAWLIQPYDFDFRQRQPDGPNPPVNPDSAKLFSPGTKVLVVTAHPDDEAYYIGGTLSKLGKAGAKITMVVTTFGDKGYYGPFTDVDANRKVRRQEAIESSTAFGGKEVVFMGLPDGRVKNTDNLRQAIADQIRRVQPDYLFTFDDLYPTRISHRDHRRTGEAAVQAAHEAGFTGWVMLFMTGAPNYDCDISKYWDDKCRLLAVHKSQFNGERLNRIKLSLMSDAIDAGEATNVEYAEPFRVYRLRPRQAQIPSLPVQAAS